MKSKDIAFRTALGARDITESVGPVDEKGKTVASSDLLSREYFEKAHVLWPFIS